MAWKNLYSGTSSSSWIGQNASIYKRSTDAAKAELTKPKEPTGFRALLKGMNDLKDGFLPGMLHIAKSGYSDADKALAGVLPGEGNDEWQSDDIAKLVWDDTKTRYSPLFNGDFKEFGHQLNTKPLDFLLDAATIAALAATPLASAGVKIATTPAKAARVASKTTKGGKVVADSFLVRMAGYVPRTEARVARAEKAYGKGSKEVDTGTDFVKDTRRIGKHLGTEAVLPLGNAGTRWRNGARDGLGALKPLQDLPIIGSNRRVAKNDSRVAARNNRRLKAKVMPEVARATAKLNDAEKVAWFFLHSGSKLDDVTEMWRKHQAETDNDMDFETLDIGVKQLEDADVVAAYESPSARLLDAVEKTKKLADDDMADIITDLGWMTPRAMLERRLAQHRSEKGTTRTTEHPTQMFSPAYAARAKAWVDHFDAETEKLADAKVRAAERLVDKTKKSADAKKKRKAEQALSEAIRLRDQIPKSELLAKRRMAEEEQVPLDRLSDAEKDAAGPILEDSKNMKRKLAQVDRERTGRESQQQVLRDSIAMIDAILAAPLKGGKAISKSRKAKMVTRVLTDLQEVIDLGLTERINTIPGAGTVMTGDEIAKSIRRMRYELTRSARHAPARKKLHDFLVRAYEATYRPGGKDPARENKYVKGRAQRKAAADKKNTQVSAHSLNAAMDKHGSWSREVVLLVDASGSLDNQKKFWRQVRADRAENKQGVDTPAQGSVEESLINAGFHPYERYLNMPDDDVLIGVLEEWLEQDLKSMEVQDIANGVVPDGGLTSLDMESAQALIRRVRESDPDGNNIENSDVARVWAEDEFMPPSALNDAPAQKDYVAQLSAAMLEIFEKQAVHSGDTSTFNDIRKRDVSYALGEMLGLVDPDGRMNTYGEDWVTAINRAVEDAGFDENYIKDSVSLREAEAKLVDEGAEAFRKENWVADESQKEYGTLTEAVAAVSEKQARMNRNDSRSLSGTMSTDLKRLRRKLEAQIGKLDNPSDTAKTVLTDAETPRFTGLERHPMQSTKAAKIFGTQARKMEESRLAKADAAQKRAERLEAEANDPNRNDAQVEHLLKRADEIRAQRLKSKKRARQEARSNEQKPTPLKDVRDKSAHGDYLKYWKEEGVDPETGLMWRDIYDDMTEAELRAEVERNGGSYMPHKAPSGTGSGSRAGLFGDAAVKGAPGRAKSYGKQHTGRRYETASFDFTPEALLREAEVLLRARHAKDLYSSALIRGIPFDAAVYNMDTKKWVVLPSEKQAHLAKQIKDSADSLDLVNNVFGASEQTSLNVRGMLDRAVTDAVTGDAVMVPRSYYKALTNDLVESSKLVKMMIDRPLDFFRAFTLFLRPAYYVNNFVGQHMLLAVKEGGIGWIPRYIKFLAEKGEASATKVLAKELGDGANSHATWGAYAHHEMRELGGQSFYDLEGAASIGNSANTLGRIPIVGKYIKSALNAPKTLARLGSVLSDDITRQFRAVSLMQPHIKNARAKGHKGTDLEIGMELLKDVDFKDRIMAQTMDDLIDYDSLSHFEKTAMRRVMPFYSWLRGMSEWTARLALDEPHKLWLLDKVGQTGMEIANEDWDGVVPEWARGMITVGEPKEGLQRAISTQGMNVFETPGQVLDIIDGATSNDFDAVLGSQKANTGNLNPFIRAFLENTLNGGKDFNTGFARGGITATLDAEGGAKGIPGGFIGATVMSPIAELPQTQLIRRWKTIQKRKQTGETSSGVYNSPISDYGLSYLGLPIRNVNLENAAARKQADEERLANLYAKRLEANLESAKRGKQNE